MNEAKQGYWLEQAEADVPAGNQWLSAEEIARLTGLRFHKRWTEWRLGRWTAKRALAWWLNLPADVPALRDIELQSAPSGAPEVFLFKQRVDTGLSLSHRSGKALCFIGPAGASLGCDLELVEARDDSFVTDFFTTNEQNLVRRVPAEDQATLITLLWSAKESALKALHVGLRVDTNFVEVTPNKPLYLTNVDRWNTLSVRCLDGPLMCGWWRCSNDMVRTLVFNPLQ